MGGPRSQVKRDRSSSPEDSPPVKTLSTEMKKESISRSVSPSSPAIQMNIDKLVEGLASTESEPEKKDEKVERSKVKEEHGENKHKYKKKKKHKDRDRERDRDKDKERSRD